MNTMAKRNDFEDDIDLYDDNYEDESYERPKKKRKQKPQDIPTRTTTIRTTMVPVLNKQYLNEALILNIILGTATGLLLFSPETVQGVHSILQWGIIILSIVLFGRSFTKSNAALANGLSLGSAGLYLIGWGTELFSRYFKENAPTEGFTVLGASLPFVGFILSIAAVLYIVIAYNKERK